MMLRAARWIARTVAIAGGLVAVLVACSPAALAQDVEVENWWQKLLDPRTLMALVGLGAAVVAGWTRIQSHCGDQSIHHTREDLDKAYMPRELSDERWANLHATLARIEAAITDAHSGRRS